MSILSGFSPFKKYKKTSDGYKLQSDWTHSDTVEFTDGSNLTTKVGTTSIASIGDGSITGAISSVNTNKADLVNGKVPLSQIPNTALNIRKEVANDTARFALTTADVQTGDTVKVLSTDMIYLVVDDTNLDNENGYMPYAQTVTWDTISGKPSDIAYYDVESAQTGTAMSPVLRQSDLVTSTTSSSTTKPLAAYAGNTLNTKINNVRDTLAGDIAETYSTTATYAVGDYCLRNQVLYKCNTAITSGESWNSSHWTQVKAGDELETINTEIGDTSISSIGDGSITGAISSLNSTLTNNTINTGISDIAAVKYGNIVTLTIIKRIETSSTGWYLIGTLPDSLKPAIDVYTIAIDNNISSFASSHYTNIRLLTDGKLSIYMFSDKSALQTATSFTYITS